MKFIFLVFFLSVFFDIFICTGLSHRVLRLLDRVISQSYLALSSTFIVFAGILEPLYSCANFVQFRETLSVLA